MNARRRRKLDDALRVAVDELEQIRDAEQESIDNLPESLQGSSTCQAAQDVVEAIEETLSVIETLRTAAGL